MNFKTWFMEDGKLYHKGMFMIETLERRSVNSDGNKRGIIPTLLITNSLEGNWRFAVCEECEIIIPEWNLDKPVKRKINGKYYCLKCIIEKRLAEDKQTKLGDIENEIQS